MQTLSPTLLAAQRRLGATASVRVRVEDRELRWAPLLDQPTSECQSAACAAAGAIVRARITPAGTLDVQRITAPAEPAGWLTWTTLATDADPASDVALSALAADANRLRLFYVRAAAIACWQSADGGASWTGASQCVPGLSTPAVSLASANAQLLYHDPSTGLLTLARASAWQGGAWSAEPWAAAGALAARYGIGAGYLGGVYYVASADEEAVDVRRLRSGTFDEAAGSWSTPTPVAPPGLPAAGYTPRWPSLAYAAGAWHLAYVETLSGVLSYADPLAMHSPDWVHWSFTCWVPLEALGPVRRPALIHHDGAFYLALESAVWRAAAYDAADPDRALEEAQVAGYTVDEAPWSGRTLVELYNPGGRYDRPGVAGSPAAPLRPLARVSVERGYRTATGEERVARAPGYIVAAAVRRGGVRPTLRLECEDGWGLLRRWRPDALYLWQGKTVAWLIAEVLYRAAGLECAFDGLSAWQTVLDAFALSPGQWDETLSSSRRSRLSRELEATRAESGGANGLSALQALLAKVGGAGRWQADGRLYCFIPSAQGCADPYVVGQGGEVLDALYGRGLMLPTQARVYGEGVAGVAWAPRARGSPRRYVATVVDTHLETALACNQRAAAIAAAGQARRCSGWVETPCQCGLELYDVITVDDERAGELAGDHLRVVGIVEEYDPAAGRFSTRATLEGV